MAAKAPPPASTAKDGEAPLPQDKTPAVVATNEAARTVTANHRLRVLGSGTSNILSYRRHQQPPRTGDVIIIAHGHDRTVRSCP